MEYQLLIQGSKIYEPIVLSDITWESERVGTPSKLTFTVVKDQKISFPEGAKVQLKVNGKGVFIGFIFKKQRDKEHHIECTAYDQLRYLKNKDYYLIRNKKASDVVRMIANDFGLTCGEIEDTGFTLPAKIEDGQTLFDIILNALDTTYDSNGKLYVLYDDFGKICLKNIESMRLNTPYIDNETAENFDYVSSIDDDTYNQIKLVKVNEQTKKREIFLVRDNKAIGNWGVLQHYQKINENTNGQALADTLLALKNRKTRNLSISNCLGDPNVRAGCSLPVHLNLGDIVTQQYMICDKVTHHFTAEHHSMDLTLIDLNTFV